MLNNPNEKIRKLAEVIKSELILSYTVLLMLFTISIANLQVNLVKKKELVNFKFLPMLFPTI